MYNRYKSYPRYYYSNTPMYNPYDYPCSRWVNTPIYYPDNLRPLFRLRDYGPEPFAINIGDATEQNNTFRTALWTGQQLQITLMSINVGEDIGLEMHPDTDQFIRIEQGQGLIMMGDTRDELYFQKRVHDDYVIVIPAGKWHNLINTGYRPLKLYSIYAPPEHPHGTVHETKKDAEEHNGY